MSDTPVSEEPSGPFPCEECQAGVMRLTWSYAPSYEIGGRVGIARAATITECHSRGWLPRDVVIAALMGMIVQDPEGTPKRIVGVEAHCTSGLGVGATLGLLLLEVSD